MKTIYTAVLIITCSTFAQAGLVAHWTFNGNDKNQAKDSSPNHNSATLTNVKRVKGKFGNGIAVSTKSGSGIEVKNSPLLNPQKAITISVWVKFTEYSYPKTYELVNKSLDSGKSYNTSYRFRLSYGMLNLVVGDGEKSYALISQIYGKPNSKFVIDKWYHLVATFDGMKMRYFIDGIETTYVLPKEMKKNIIESPAHIKPNEHVLTLGCYARNSASYRFNGVIDDIRIYDNAISQRAILELSRGMSSN